MWTRWRQSLTATLDLLLPPVCLLCSGELAPASGTSTLCTNCLSNISPLAAGHCSCCAQPFHSSASDHLCGNCLKHPPAFSFVHVTGTYQGSIKEAVHRLKYRSQIALAKPLGELMATSLKTQNNDFHPDKIIPVPLHLKRLRQRGYNQAVELARPIAKTLNTPLDVKLLQRTRHTPPQQGLPAKDRRKNLRDAFTLTAAPGGAKILLIDDVMTTGETLRECSRALLKGGAFEIRAAVVGRA